MDLALQFGWSLAQLERELTEDELGRWMVYDRVKRLPWRRMELYLARIAWMHSDGKQPLSDFVMFKRPPAPEKEEKTRPVEEATNVINAAFGGGMKFFKLGQRKVISRG